MELNLTPLELALASLKEVAELDRAKQDLKMSAVVRDSAIQRFEYTYELAWKTLQRYLQQDMGVDNVDHLSRKDLFRLAAEKALLNDPEQWFEYHQKRNRTSHTYDLNTAESVYRSAVSFVHDAQQLLDVLQKRIDD